MKTLREWLESLDTEKITAAYINNEYRIRGCDEGVRITSKYPPEELATYIQAEVRDLISRPPYRSRRALVFFAKKQYSGPFSVTASLCSLTSLLGKGRPKPIDWWYLRYAEIVDAYVAETTLTTQNIGEFIVSILHEKHNYGGGPDDDLINECTMYELKCIRAEQNAEFEDWLAGREPKEGDLMDKVAKASYQLSRYYFDLAVEDVRNYLHDDADVDSILRSKPSYTHSPYHQERLAEFT